MAVYIYIDQSAAAWYFLLNSLTQRAYHSSRAVPNTVRPNKDSLFNPFRPIQSRSKHKANIRYSPTFKQLSTKSNSTTSQPMMPLQIHACCCCTRCCAWLFFSRASNVFLAFFMFIIVAAAAEQTKSTDRYFMTITVNINFQFYV